MKPVTDTPLVTRHTEDGVLTLTLSSAEPGHPLTVAMTAALASALEDASRQPDVHCVLLRSTGRHFCSGGNVKDMRDGADLMQGGVEEVRERLRRRRCAPWHARATRSPRRWCPRPASRGSLPRSPGCHWFP